MIFDLSNRRISKFEYWKFRIKPNYDIDNEEEVLEEMDYLFNKAVQTRLMSDVPIGLFLSGGIDSSAILAYTLNNIDKDKIKTFTIGFNERSFDESIYAKEIADYFQVENYVEILSLDYAKKISLEILTKLDEPIGDASIIPTYLLCNHARRDVKVALSGDGGDELLAGYDPFTALKYAEYYKKYIPNIIHKGMIKLTDLMPISQKNMSFDFKIKRSLKGLSYDPCIWNPVWLAPGTPEEINQIFNEPIDAEELYSEAIQLWDECDGLDNLDRSLEFYTKFYMPGNVLAKVDRASMMNSLESRAVFLDKDLAEFCMQLPNHFKFKNGKKKYILKKLLSNKLPTSVLDRKKKGFGMPVAKWLMDYPRNIPLKEVSGVNVSNVEKFWLKHRSKEEDNRMFMWNWYVLQQFI